MGSWTSIHFQPLTWYGTNGYKHLLLWNHLDKFLDTMHKWCLGDGLPRLFKWDQPDDFWLSYKKLNLVIAATYLIWVQWLQTSSSLKPLFQILRYYTGIMPRWRLFMVVLLVSIKWFLAELRAVELCDSSHLADLGIMATNIFFPETAIPNS